jgi:pimeloyl-ACP methyl ester carboxylesterase
VKKLARVLCAAAPALSAAFLAEELYAYVFLRRGSPLLARFLDKKGHEEAYYIARDSAAARLRQAPCERWELRSARGERLQGFYYPTGAQGRRVAFLLHGYRSEHVETAGLYYDYYASRGFDLFCCDHAAHGESEGSVIGFDLYESEDCLRWLDELIARFGPETQIVLHGFSMGAATVMKMSARCPENVRFLVEDSGFLDARRQLRGQLGAAFAPLTALHRLLAFDLAETDVRASLTQSRIPLLVVHGMQDSSVPFDNAPEIYALYPGEKDSLFSEKARHIETMWCERGAYEEKLDGMIRRYVR